jgi:hypothetical protein
VDWWSFVIVVLNLWVLLAPAFLVPSPSLSAKLLGSTDSLNLQSMKWETSLAAYLYSTHIYSLAAYLYSTQIYSLAAYLYSTQIYTLVTSCSEM